MDGRGKEGTGPAAGGILLQGLKGDRRPCRELPVNTDTHYVGAHRTHNLPIVSPTRYQ